MSRATRARAPTACAASTRQNSHPPTSSTAPARGTPRSRRRPEPTAQADATADTLFLSGTCLLGLCRCRPGGLFLLLFPIVCILFCFPHLCLGLPVLLRLLLRLFHSCFDDLFFCLLSPFAFCPFRSRCSSHLFLVSLRVHVCFARLSSFLSYYHLRHGPVGLLADRIGVSGRIPAVSLPD